MVKSHILGLLRRIVAFAERPHRVVVAGVLRTGLGTMSLLYFVSHVRERTFTLGPNGMVDYDYYVHSAAFAQPFPLYALNGSVAWTEILFWSSVLFSVTFTLGILPRLSGILLYLLVNAAFARNWEVIDGGHNVLVLVLFYLCFADLRSGALYAPDTLTWLTRRLSWREPVLRFGRYVRTVFHNGALALVVGQICILYFFSAFYKIQGPKWQDGTAVYYVLRTAEFAFPPFSAMLFHSAVAVTALTYMTLVYQMSFPFLMWNRRLKPFLFAGAVGLHSGIAIFMGLALFSMTMIVADIALFDDATLVRTYRWLAGLGRHASALIGRRPVAIPVRAEAEV